MNNDEYALYKKLLSLTQAELLQTLPEILSKYYKNLKVTKDYILAKGDIPIALCAHMDTVFNSPAKYVLYDREEDVIQAPGGAGHDDRAGIFMILQLIFEGLRPHVIFTTDEEIGCVGAEKLPRRADFFGDLRYIIQLDRRGVDDCVFYYEENREFINYISSFGFKEQKGSFTDIVVICPKWKVAGVNLSIGYFNEHSASELLFVGVYEITKKKVRQMLLNPPAKAFPHKETSKRFSLFNQKVGTCAKCKQKVIEEDLFPVKRINGKIKEFCIDCMAENVNWCEICCQPFETKESERLICYECERASAEGNSIQSKYTS